MFYSREIHVVNDPNLVGVAANLQTNVYTTPREAGLGLATCYYPTQTTNTCDPMIAAFTTPNINICEGDCITFNNTSSGASIVSYDWTFPGGTPANFSGQMPPQVCFANQGTYDIELTTTDCAGLTETTVVQITVSDCSGPPTADFDVPAQICAGECLNFTDLSSANTTQWNWTFNGGVTPNSTDQNPQNICFDTPGIHTIELEASNPNGADVHQETIEVLTSPDAGPDHSYQYCETEAIVDLLTLLAPGIDLNGTFEDLTNSGGLTNSVFDPSVTGQGNFIILYVLNNGSCADTAEFNIFVESMNAAGFDGATTVCDYDNPIDLYNVITGTPLQGGIWSPWPVSGTSIFDPQVDAAGMYTYIVAPIVCNTDSSIATVNITFVSDVVIDPVATLCASNGTEQLTANVANGTWSGLGVDNLGVFNPSQVGSGTYIIEYEVNEDNCIASDTIAIEVGQEPSLDLGDNQIICNNEMLVLEAITNPGDVITWDNGSNGNSYPIDFSEFNPNETITVTAEVVNYCGTATSQISFEIEDCDVYVYIPNAFTPDGDEHNQTFKPVITGENIDSFELRVFNRWGQTVFVSYDQNVGWDGTYSGFLVPDGIYSWTLELHRTKSNQVEVITEIGHVSIVR